MAESYDLIPVQVVELVKKKKTYKSKEKQLQIISFIVKELSKTESKEKNDIGNIQRCCDLIENMVKKSDKINKFEIAVEVFKILGGAILQPNEIEMLKTNINHLLDCKNIKRVKLYRKAYSYIKRVVVSNFLFRGV